MITWIVDTLMEDLRYSPPGTVQISDAARDLGHTVIDTKYTPFSEESSVELDDPEGLACGYGTIGFLRLLRKKYPRLRPGGFFENHRFSVSYGESRYGGYMLNARTRLDEVDSFPASQMPELLPGLVDKYGPLFVRPNEVGKLFSGSRVGTHSFPVHHFLSYVESITHGHPDELVQVRKFVDILGEYRFVCATDGYGSIIASSQYRYEDVHDERVDVHPAAAKLAKTFLTEGQGPDLVYVMDIAVLPDETAKIIEFNNFSNCGLYACNRHAVVEQVSALIEGAYGR